MCKPFFSAKLLVMSNKPKVIAVVGPTSSGKTSLSIELAKKFNGEVISADSRQVYKGLDLGSGKVTEREKQGIPHHLLDIVEPMQVYTAAEFERDANNAIVDINNRGRLPIIAGGTFFYLDILRGKQQSAPVEPDETFRTSLFDCSNCELFKRLKESDPERAKTIDSKNRSRLVRALEIINSLGKVPKLERRETPYDWLVIGLNVDKLRLYKNIHTRLLERIEAGMIDEAERLHKQGMSYERMYQLGLEYRYMSMYLQQEINRDKMIPKLETKIRQFAKRQRSWLKRDDEIEWFDPENKEAINKRVEKFLYPEES